MRAGITTETHAAEIADLLFYQDLKDVVLAGTSTGGMVMARAAELARERVARVVFADALALLDGEALPDIVKRPTAVNTELTSGPSRQDFETRLFADLDPGDAAPGRSSAAPCIRSRRCRRRSGWSGSGTRRGMPR